MTGRRRGAATEEPVGSTGSGRPDSKRGPVATHHATVGTSKLVGRIAVAAYHLTATVVGHLPERAAYWIMATLTQGSYVFWPQKRRYANLNFGHVLGLPPDDPAVRRLALAAHRHYARYLVELMRLPRLRLENAARMVELQGEETLVSLMGEGAVILVAAHIGNNELIAAGIASRDWKMSVLGDDSALPELFEFLADQRRRLGVQIIPWRNLREIYGVLKRGELLGLLVDWGYRSDGIPVRLFDAWTTLPSGPAVLAARSGAVILPVAARRRPDGTVLVTHDTPIRVTSTDPAELARATQAIADALARTVAAAPEQWYSFKPLWPATADELAEMERRLAARGLVTEAGRADG